MKEFDLEAAKKGAPVCTRNGQKARILCFDRKDVYYPIVVCIDYGNEEDIFSYTYDGRLNINNAEPSPIDLIMAPNKHEGWINVLNCKGEYVSSGVWNTEEEATEIGQDDKGYVTTIKIEWEE